MSLIEELESVENRVLARLRELEPLVAEHRELSRIASRLGLDVNQATTPRSKQPARASTSPRAAGSDAPGRKKASPKASGSRGSAAARDGGSTRERQVLATIQATPGLTVGELAKHLDVAPSSLYPVVRKLTQERVLVKRGLALHPRK
jgi:hypothetical protein